jgi:acyl dehydratase
MEINGRGVAMPADRFPVEASHIMMFARSVCDDNPIYYDEDYAAGTEVGRIIAPPTFAQASAQFDPDYPLRPRVGQPWLGSGAGPGGAQSDDEVSAGAGGLHAEQHFQYHRHLQPGDLLRATSRPGETWQKQSKRAGTLTFTETITDYHDQNGDLVITARVVIVFTERPVSK